MQTNDFFKSLIHAQKSGDMQGICSICSANAYVIEAAMEFGRDENLPVLVEATANQVNQFGGYTGMRPDDFMSYALRIAEKAGLPREQLILGGDHLGPLTWSAEKEADAMSNAEALVTAFVNAGFRKIHLDASMRLADDSTTERLSDDTIARRAARLCAAAEKAAGNGEKPVYVIGSEVPIPGGATENEDSLSVTSPADLKNTLTAFKNAFHEKGLDDAFSRVIAVVVQPGVEFADNTIIRYDADKARELISYTRSLPDIILEGHSTDYQPHSALLSMRKSGIAILKVGPALTFAFREALFALEGMEKALYPFTPANGYSHFSGVLEQKLMREPKYWARYYHGGDSEQAFARKYSLSDRCRYYLEDPDIQSSIDLLVQNINAKPIPFGLLSQFFPAQKDAALMLDKPVSAQWLIKDHIKDVIRTYY